MRFVRVRFVERATRGPIEEEVDYGTVRALERALRFARILGGRDVYHPHGLFRLYKESGGLAGEITVNGPIANYTGLPENQWDAAEVQRDPS